MWGRSRFRCPCTGVPSRYTHENLTAKKKIWFLCAKLKWYLRTFFLLGQLWWKMKTFYSPPLQNHWSADMKCHDSLSPHQKSSPLPHFYLFILGACSPLHAPSHLATPSWWKQWLHILWDVSCTFHVKIEHLHILTASCLHINGWCIFTDLHILRAPRMHKMWMFAHLRVKYLHKMWLILDENNDLHICGMFAHLTSKFIEPLHIWRRHVCTLLVDVFLQIFAHLRATCLHKCGCMHICGFCTFHACLPFASIWKRHIKTGAHVYWWKYNLRTSMKGIEFGKLLSVEFYDQLDFKLILWRALL